MVSSLTHWANVVGAYVEGEDPELAAVEERLTSAAESKPGGKFSKEEALYLPQAPFPPTLWRTSCGRCRFWHEGEPGEPGHCHIVGRDGDPYGGEAIHYRGWCALWMPPRGEPAFAWISERLKPTGKTSVRGRYDPQVTTDQRRREHREKTLRAADGGRRDPDDAGTSPGGAEADDGD